MDSLRTFFSEPPQPSKNPEELTSKYAQIAINASYPPELSALADYAKSGDPSSSVFMGRMYKAYCVIHSVLSEGSEAGVDPMPVLLNLNQKIRVCGGDLQGVKVPRVKFGKTGLDISIITNGSMRFQQTWTQTVTDESLIEKECQENLKRTLIRALDMGINHFETARGYGSSEIQMGKAFKEIFEETDYKREDILIQSKVNPQATREKFVEEIEKTFKFLQVDYLDLFSFHGLANKARHYDDLFNPETGLYEVIEDYVRRGKIKHVGFR